MKYDQVYRVVKQVPEGRVATYGQIAKIVDSCSARQVGYAMAALPKNSGVPWQRIINSQGQISLRKNGRGHSRQQSLLKKEGICFGKQGSVDLDQYGWKGPDTAWLLENGFDPPLYKE